MGSQAGITNPDYDLLRAETGVETQDAIRRLYQQVGSLLAQIDTMTSSPLVLSRCVAFATATQSIPASLFTFLVLDSEDVDSFSMHSPSDNTKVVVRVDGVYRLAGSCRISGSAGATGLALFVNGSPVRINERNAAGAAGDDYVVERMMFLTAGSIVQLAAIQSTGGALAVGSPTRALAAELAVFSVT